MEISDELFWTAARAGIPAEEPSVSSYVLHDRFIYYRGFDLRAAIEAVAPAIRAAAMEEAAKIAENHTWTRDIDWWLNATKKSVSAETALECAAAIRAAKEVN